MDLQESIFTNFSDWKKINKGQKLQLNSQYKIQYVDNKGELTRVRMFSISEDDQRIFEKSLKIPLINNEKPIQTMPKQTKAICKQHFTKGCKTDNCSQSHDPSQLADLINQNNKDGKVIICRFHFCQKNCTKKICKYSHQDKHLKTLIKNSKDPKQKKAHQDNKVPDPNKKNGEKNDQKKPKDSNPSPQKPKEQDQLKQKQTIKQKNDDDCKNGQGRKFTQELDLENLKLSDTSESIVFNEEQPKPPKGRKNKKDQVCLQHFSDKCTKKNCKQSHDINKLFNLIQDSNDQRLPKICKFHFTQQGCKEAENCKSSHNDTDFVKFIEQINQIIREYPGMELVQQDPGYQYQKQIQQQNQ